MSAVEESPRPRKRTEKNLYDDSTERNVYTSISTGGKEALFSSPCGSRLPGWRHCRSRTPASALMAFPSPSSKRTDSQCVFDESVQVELGRDETGSHDLRRREPGGVERKTSEQSFPSLLPHSAPRSRKDAPSWVQGRQRARAGLPASRGRRASLRRSLCHRDPC